MTSTQKIAEKLHHGILASRTYKNLALLLPLAGCFFVGLDTPVARAGLQDLSQWCVNKYGREWFGSRRTSDDAPLCTGPVPEGGGQIHREVSVNTLCPNGTVRFTGNGALYECVAAAAKASGPENHSLDKWCSHRFGQEWFGTRRQSDGSAMCSKRASDTALLHRVLSSGDLCQTGAATVSGNGKEFSCAGGAPAAFAGKKKQAIPSTANGRQAKGPVAKSSISSDEIGGPKKNREEQERQARAAGQSTAEDAMNAGDARQQGLNQADQAALPGAPGSETGETTRPSAGTSHDATRPPGPEVLDANCAEPLGPGWQWFTPREYRHYSSSANLNLPDYQDQPRAWCIYNPVVAGVSDSVETTGDEYCRQNAKRYGLPGDYNYGRHINEGNKPHPATGERYPFELGGKYPPYWVIGRCQDKGGTWPMLVQWMCPGKSQAFIASYNDRPEYGADTLRYRCIKKVDVPPTIEVVEIELDW